MKLFIVCLFFYPFSNCAMELVQAQDQASRLLAQRNLQDNMRLKASEDQRAALELSVKREREKIARLETELNALRAANNAISGNDTIKKAHFSTTISDNVTRGIVITGIGVIGWMFGYWCAAKNNTAAHSEEKKDK